MELRGGGAEGRQESPALRTECSKDTFKAQCPWCLGHSDPVPVHSQTSYVSRGKGLTCEPQFTHGETGR